MEMHHAKAQDDEVPRHRKLKRSHERRRFTIEYFTPKGGVWSRWTKKYVTEKSRDEAVVMLTEKCRSIGWVFRAGA